MATMVIDVHAHVCAAPELYQWKAVQMSARGAHGYAPRKFSDEYVSDHAETRRNLRIMDSVGTDVQFLSPGPLSGCVRAAAGGWRAGVVRLPRTRALRPTAWLHRPSHRHRS